MNPKVCLNVPSQFLLFLCYFVRQNNPTGPPVQYVGVGFLCGGVFLVVFLWFFVVWVCGFFLGGGRVYLGFFSLNAIFSNFPLQLSSGR